MIEKDLLEVILPTLEAKFGLLEESGQACGARRVDLLQAPLCKAPEAFDLHTYLGKTGWFGSRHLKIQRSLEKPEIVGPGFADTIFFSRYSVPLHKETVEQRCDRKITHYRCQISYAIPSFRIVQPFLRAFSGFWQVRSGSAQSCHDTRRATRGCSGSALSG
jgi:hypothetical protein